MKYYSHALHSTTAACIVTEIHALAFSCNTAFLSHSQICTSTRNKETTKTQRGKLGCKRMMVHFLLFLTSFFFWMGKLGITWTKSSKVWLMKKIASWLLLDCYVYKIGSMKVWLLEAIQIVHSRFYRFCKHLLYKWEWREMEKGNRPQLCRENFPLRSHIIAINN